MVERVHGLKAAPKMSQVLEPIFFAGSGLWKTPWESIPEDFLAKSPKQRDAFDGGLFCNVFKSDQVLSFIL